MRHINILVIVLPVVVIVVMCRWFELIPRTYPEYLYFVIKTLHEEKYSPINWHIKSEYIGSSAVALAQKDACILRFKSDHLGYIRLVRYTRYSAIVEAGYLSFTNAVPVRSISVTNETISILHPRHIPWKEHLIYLACPNELNFHQEDVSQIAIVPFVKIKGDIPFNTNDVCWIKIESSKL